jgi:peptidoglycan hydrolase CwlO-like protein
MKKEKGLDGILVSVGLCIIALLLCVVMKDSLTELQNVKKSLEKDKSDLNAYITKLDSNLDEIQKKIKESRFWDSVKGD